MDTIRIKAAAWRDHKFDRECLVLAAGLLLILLSLSRYVVNGEPVDIRSDTEKTGIELPLSDGMEIMQPLTITEEMNWRQGYYALRFAKCDAAGEGQVVYTVEQGETVQTGSLALRDIKAGKWTRLDKMALGRLECGGAILRLRTQGVAVGALAVAAGPDYYGFGSVDHNGAKQDLTLAQAYHYHVSGMEYRIRLICYAFAALCAVMLVAVIHSGRIGERGKCLAAFGIMTVMFMALIWILDSSIYLEPTYAEAVTNFLQNAREKKFLENLLITDAGYLPLLPRLITLFFVKVIRIPSAYALYLMQITACLLCSMIWSFFVLHPFQSLMKLSGRILFCILVMLTCFCEETLFFTNHAYWGIYFLLLMMLADLKAFPRWIYAGLTVFGALFCLSKGTYAVVLPLAVLAMVFWHRLMDGREKIFLSTVGAAAFLQLLYSFSGQGDGSGWISAASEGGIGYWFRMLCRVFVEFTAYLLLPLGKYEKHICVVILFLTPVVLVLLAVCFEKTVVLSLLHRETVSRPWRNFWLASMYQMIVTAFFLVTVKPVPNDWKSMGNVAFRQMGHKYEIFSDIGFFMLLLTGSILLRQTGQSAAEDAKSAAGNGIRHDICEICGRYGILLLTAVFCLTNPVMQLKGWAKAEISDARGYAGDINAGWWECRDVLYQGSFFIPVRGDNWGYSRHATICQVGTDIYFEETSCINLEEEITGYHSFYEVQEETQAQQMIGVVIDRPQRIGRTDCRVRLLDAEDRVIAEAAQADSGRYKKCRFVFDEPIDGVKKITFVDGNGKPIWFKDYIAWVSAW